MQEKNIEDLYNETFELNKNKKTITGTVIQVSSNGEIYVDFQYKADGIIPKMEYSENTNEDPRNEFNSGDVITADVLKWNDGFGNVLLSYKRYKQREKLKNAKAMKIKQSKERKIQQQEKIRSIEEFWKNIEVGKKYRGLISKITDYGIFVNLGGVTGLAHISELVWNKNEKLENIFKINDEILVQIKSFNKNERKISLKYPEKGENPWILLADKYRVNDIVTCKVSKLTSFGAFLEIEEGLEGLVHNSEITSLRKVVKPEEELKLGQLVNAKIITLDKEKLKINLSIKELEGTSSQYGYEEFISKKH